MRPHGVRRLTVEEWIIAVIMCMMVLMVFFNVLGRYLFNFSFSHTEEIVRYLFVWMTFLGAGAAVQRRRHIRVTAHRHIPSSIAAALNTSVGACAVGFSLMLVWYGFRVMLLQMRTGQRTAALGMPMWLVGSAIPVASVILIIRILTAGPVKNDIGTSPDADDR